MRCKERGGEISRHVHSGGLYVSSTEGEVGQQRLHEEVRLQLPVKRLS